LKTTAIIFEAYLPIPRAKIIQPAAFGGLKTAILPFPKIKNRPKTQYFS